MPLSDYRTLSLDGINIDQASRQFSVLKGTFGEGYGVGDLTGEANGNLKWTLTAGVWPDDEAYQDLIEGMTRMEYYWSFFTEHVSAGQKPFLIEWRGRMYFASFDTVEIDAQVFALALFSGGVTIKQRRVKGYPDSDDGSVVDP